jgi:hypothetical protein
VWVSLGHTPLLAKAEGKLPRIMPVHTYLAVFFAMTGKCVALHHIKHGDLGHSPGAGHYIEPVVVSRSMLPGLWQHGFYMARVVASFKQLELTTAPQLAPLSTCIASPAFHIVANAIPQADRQRVRGAIRQTALLLASHACNHKPF